MFDRFADPEGMAGMLQAIEEQALINEAAEAVDTSKLGTDLGDQASFAFDLDRKVGIAKNDGDPRTFFIKEGKSVPTGSYDNVRWPVSGGEPGAVRITPIRDNRLLHGGHKLHYREVQKGNYFPVY